MQTKMTKITTKKADPSLPRDKDRKGQTGKKQGNILEVTKMFCIFIFVGWCFLWMYTSLICQTHQLVYFKGKNILYVNYYLQES